MGYEIDFLQVGEESKSGDAIALRWGDLHERDQFIAVIDGGFTESGEQLANLIRKYYGNPTTIDLVVSTHPDADHINGLSHILDSFHVKKLWIHLPWEHNDDIAAKFKDGRVTDNSIGERLKVACEAAWNLSEKARANNVEVQEPFSCQGMTIEIHGGQLKILGPSINYYEELLPEFGGLPATVEKSFSATLAEVGRKLVNLIKEFWNRDSIDDSGETSAKNNSSVILELTYANRRLLFTADAGIPALDRASAVAGNAELKMVQIPHHGSRRNVGPMVLNQIVGEIVEQGVSKEIWAPVSCAKKNPDNKHPNKRVLNAFTRRGCSCYSVEGAWRHHLDAPDRQAYTSAKKHPFYGEFYGEVEEE